MTDKTITIEITLSENDDVRLLLGAHDKNIKIIEDSTGTVIHTRGELIQIVGETEAAEKAQSVIRALQELIKRGINISTPDVITALNMVNKGSLDYFKDMYEEEIIKDRNGKPIRAKNAGQKKYIEVQKIILTRPAVEAGENLGFLPGDLKEKVDPYLRPVYDALYQIFGMDHTNRLMERGVIEIAPLAYMRGRTLEDAFVILDEAQNTTIAQMKMFLTRLGFNSKMIVNGDTSQIDLPKGTLSGLIHAE